MRQKIVYYRDALKDDFGGKHGTGAPVDASFPYLRTSPAWRAGAFLLYYGVALPLVWLINRLWFGLRVKNRRALRSLRKRRTGWFFYGNHTRAFPDATAATLLAFPRRGYVVANPDAVSIRGLSHVVQLLGAIPLPTALGGMRPFCGALERRVREGGAVMIYPEAHTWPFYTGVRPFTAASFAYPARLGAPVVAVASVYRKRLLPFLPPAMTLYLSDPILPDPALSPAAQRDVFRDRVYAFLTEKAALNEVEYIRYEKAPGA